MIEQQNKEPLALRNAVASPLDWQLTVDALDALVVMVGVQGRVVAANEGARQAAISVGVPNLIGTAVHTLATIEPWGKAAELAHTVSEAAPLARAETEDRYSQQIWDVSARFVPSDNGGSRVLIMRDITNVVALEASARHNERVAELGRLVGNVAHEVRNPLFSMSATLDALEARLGTQPAIARYTENLRRELRRITALMQDLLEYGKPPVLDARVEALAGPVLDAVAAVSSIASARKVTLRCDTSENDGKALLDRARIAQAFQNVIENAIHYAGSGGSVSIRTHRAESDGQRWIFCSIEDSGPGFPEGVLPLVFEPFYTTRAGGTGLGLSIVQRIVQMHGGQAYAANRPEGGACITVRLPARNGEA